MDKNIWTFVGLLGLVGVLVFFAVKREEAEDTCGEGFE